MKVSTNNRINDTTWPNIVVLGAGAVGSYFGGLLARSGAPVTLIGREMHVSEINRNGLFIERTDYQEYVRINATTEFAPVADADIVLVCVKTIDTEQIAKSLAPFIKAGASVVSLQNGVDNVERMRAASGIEAFAAAVYVAVQFSAPGKLKHNGRGELIVGDILFEGKTTATRKVEMEKIAAAFTRGGITCHVSSEIKKELWLKLVMNCAYNAVSALTGAQYATIMNYARTREIVMSLVEETVAVAKADGIDLPREETIEAVINLGRTMGTAISSTAQDIKRNKLTEIDSLTGYVVARGKAQGIATPVSNTVYALVKMLEKKD
jgi:2-dehydropantoate 2-reductase